MHALRILVAASALAASPVAVAGQPSPFDPGVREHVFENGLRLLVVERPGDPRVAAKIFTDFGALAEVPGQLGAAHFLEHLMFKGTETLGTTDWDAEAPVRERIRETEEALIAARNEARNALRQRGVFHDYRHAESTPEIDGLEAELVELEAEAARYRDGGAMMRWYQAWGGTNLTATTEQEYMKFDINLPASRVEIFLRVEADRMVNSVFREFDQERMILLEQRFGDLNRPYTPFAESLASATGRIHPVFWPEGHLTDFEQYTRAYERELYEEYFVPNNTTLVFVGGVTLEAMIPMVDRYFGWMPRAPEPARVEAVEPVPVAERRVVWRSDDLAPRVELRHMIPAIGHPDRPHFDVLAEVLPVRVRSALERAGVEGSVEVDTRVIHTTRFGVPASLNLAVVLPGPEALAAAEAAVLNAMDALARGPVPDEELETARRVLRADWFRTARDADALAFELGHFQTMDRWQTLQAHLEARHGSTAADVQRIAARYLVPRNRVVGIVRPPEPGTPATEEGR